MADAGLETLQNMARINLPGVLDDALDLELGAMLREFFDRTHVWQEDIEFETEADETDYDLVPGEGVILRLMNLVDANNVPVPADLTMPETLVLRTASAAVETLTATVALNIDVTRPLSIPTWIYSKYLNGLLSGVLARMMTQQAKPYSNQTLAIYNMREFHRMIANASADVARKNTHGRQTWRFPQTWQGYRAGN